MLVPGLAPWCWFLFKSKKCAGKGLLLHITASVKQTAVAQRTKGIIRWVAGCGFNFLFGEFLIFGLQVMKKIQHVLNSQLHTRSPTFFTDSSSMPSQLVWAEEIHLTFATVCVHGMIFLEKSMPYVYTNPGLLRDKPASYHRATASSTGDKARYLTFVNLCPTQPSSNCLHFTRGSNCLRILRWFRLTAD